MLHRNLTMILREIDYVQSNVSVMALKGGSSHCGSGDGTS